MTIEESRNRELFFKIVLYYYLLHILKVLGINEELKEILSTEFITMKITSITEIFDNLMDLRILTVSGKIIIFEFKKNNVTTADLKELYKYFQRVGCQEKRKVLPIILTITDKGKIDCYQMRYETFHPKIIKTKSISKQEELTIIRKKFKNNIMLTAEECSSLVSLPIFKTDTPESELVKETCSYIKNKKQCIPKDEYRKITIPMYLNIVEYIENEKEQEQIMEDINMTGEVHGEFAKLRQEGRKEGKIEGKLEIMLSLLKIHSLQEIAEFFKINPDEIEKIINSK